MSLQKNTELSKGNTRIIYSDLLKECIRDILLHFFCF